MKKERTIEPGSDVRVVVGQEEEYHTTLRRQPLSSAESEPLPFFPLLFTLGNNNIVPRCGYATSGYGNARLLQHRLASRYDYHVCPVDTKLGGHCEGRSPGAYNMFKR
jgi:hypothetical protein